ncbi:MAG: hypothetical protein H7201_18415 [Candidatus Saccharibacteria bacterium]|nr:hypothetical protein [Microbacteriaceae bacterium]
MALRMIVGVALLLSGLYVFVGDWLVGGIVIAGGIYVLSRKSMAVSPSKALATKRPPVVMQRVAPPVGQIPASLPVPAPAPTPVPAAPLAPRLPLANETAAVLSVTPSKEVPTIVTRTAAGNGAPLFDPYADHEREWTAEEELDLIDHYERGMSMTALAQAMSIDKRQVVIRLIRLLLAPSGDIDDTVTACNDGKNYQKGDREKIVAMYQLRIPLETIANDFGRTQLGVGWQLLESKTRPVRVPDELIVARQRNTNQKRKP